MNFINLKKFYHLQLANVEIFEFGVKSVELILEEKKARSSFGGE